MTQNDKKTSTTDAPSENDLIGREGIIKIIFSIITGTDNSRIAVCGDWGSGKSTLLNLIEKKLKSDTKKAT